MSQKIIEITSQKESKSSAAVHLLPCTIHHDGPVDQVQSYWKPTESQDGKKTAFFRGRKLHGKAIRVPEGYKGIVVEKGPEDGPAETRADEPVTVDVDAEEKVATTALDTKAEFEEMVIWGHESTADASSDPYVRGVEEWVSLAEQVHSY
ncbi:hypothetical protein MGG_17682 [Pyricularia oryzae 70-15]|uniref:Uncharacterized protein n=1 Tax=Pyricularia oryzae (strain 70-15 / ATCC MYA-4617 / FGSC 8958) TaxID=242507 RepID=G4NIS7_PYRO7|nr:uncharacterized protein MGG_17682 [Pyricularia oryzae 70-15]EHA47333.1 hypothetical protein MGG_17682 [Pyricularia oryzae 70-15]